MPFPELNLKQAWLIPSAEALPNPNGTAPGLVRRAARTAGVVVALPGPPREMRPMWPTRRCRASRPIGLGARRRGPDLPADRASASRRSPTCSARTLLRAPEPDRRDLRPGRGGRRPDLGGRRRRRPPPRPWSRRPRGASSSRSATYVWATGETTWSEAIGARLAALGWSLAVVEIGTAGQLDALLGDVPWLRFDESLAADAPGALAHGRRPSDDDARRRSDRPTPSRPSRAAPASSAAARSGSRCARRHDAATPRCRSRS